MEGYFSEEELAAAKRVDLVAVASHLGYTPKRVGKFFTLKEMDSIRIYDRSHWCRWSMIHEKGMNGGSQIDFLRVFEGMDVKEAVFWLLDFSGQGRNGRMGTQQKEREILPKREIEKVPFVLPKAAWGNARLYDYLTKERCIRKTVVDHFVKKGLIYESRDYHNIVFKGNDRHGVTRFASMRGISDRGGRPFKCDVAGSDKNYGFQTSNEKNSELVVFEGAIDLMSYTDIFDDEDSNKLALGMLADAPLLTFLREHPQITLLRFCLDNDGPGRSGSEKLMEKYHLLGYEVEDNPPPEGYKDYNEWLCGRKRELANNNFSESQ